MATQKQIAANRLNARLSTGPTSDAGKAIVAANATKSGSYATRHLVLASLGESSEGYQSFGVSIVQGFSPVGPMELELATTIASLFWRLRRIPVFEASASCPPAQALPAHPDDVEAKSTLTLQSPPTSAPAETHLAYLRDQIRYFENSRITYTEALAQLASPRNCRSKASRDCPHDHARVLTEAAGLILDWPALQVPSPWEDVAAQIGFEVPAETSPRWTYPLLMKAFDHLAKQAGCTRSAFRHKVCHNLSSKLDRIESRLREVHEQEVRLVDRMRSEREHAAAVDVFSTANVVAKIQHAENHLNRQLERSLAMLERVQSRRRTAASKSTDEPLGLVNLGNARTTIGFVFPTGTFPRMDPNLGLVPRQLSPQENAASPPFEVSPSGDELQVDLECVPRFSEDEDHSAV